MIELNKDDYLLGIWFAESYAFGNIMFFFKKGKEADSWEGSFRLRYYSDGNKELEKRKIFDSDDVKKGYSIGVDSATEEEVIQKAREAFAKATDGFGMLLGKIDFTEELLIQGGFDKLMKVAETSRWLHLKKETIN